MIVLSISIASVKQRDSLAKIAALPQIIYFAPLSEEYINFHITELPGGWL